MKRTRRYGKQGRFRSQGSAGGLAKRLRSYEIALHVPKKSKPINKRQLSAYFEAEKGAKERAR